MMMIVAFADDCTAVDPEVAPDNFAYLTDVVPQIIESPRLFSTQNFLGRQAPGYIQPRMICTREAARALNEVQQEVLAQGYNLVVYDAYRPQQAVREFKRWSQDLNDQITKDLYYPTNDKRDLFKLGYIVEKSSHSRGSTFDLTLIPVGQPLKEIILSTRILTNGQTVPFLDDNTLDMGSSFDLFHEASHHDSPLVFPGSLQRREILRTAMEKAGFKGIDEEWWHYTLSDEPYSDTYFDFVDLE